MNPLCGDEVAIYVAFDDDGETIDEVKFSGRGCAISQASTSMLMEMIKGKTADEVAGMSKDELLEEIGIPLTPIRLKCALLGLGVLKVALHRAKGTPLPAEWAGLDEEFQVRVAWRCHRRLPGRGAAAGLRQDRPRRITSRSGVYNLDGATTTRSMTAARTTTGRWPRATSTQRTPSSSARATGPASTSGPAGP